MANLRVRAARDALRRRALVIALRDIAPDEELYLDYGAMYWAALRPARIPPRAFAEQERLRARCERQQEK